ncbi:MAG: tetratricopeptide repeat protein [Actinomycetales bacterium]|nr:tetratricopeptide repeat protein [Actinomycetales bacterium]
MADAVQFRVLGPLEVSIHGLPPANPGPVKQQLVLASLIVAAGRPVSVETLIDRLWDDPPPRARNAVHGHIARIRRLLTASGTTTGTPTDGPAGRGVDVVRHPAGYALQVEPEQIDLQRFGALVAAAGSAPPGDARREALLTDALGLWRGPALAGLPGQWAAGVRESAERERVDAAVRWAESLLARRRPDTVIGGLRPLCDEHPAAEHLTATFLRALVQAGRRAEALHHYSATRRYLLETLGTEPGQPLRDLHLAILRDQDPGPDPSGDPATPGSPDAPEPPPAQLPPDVAGFTGRTAELLALDRLSATPGPAGTSSPLALIAISGMAGVGKTSLAVHWAHQARHRFPDGQLHVNLRGFDPYGAVVAPGSVIIGFLEALGVTPDRLPTDLDGRIGLYRTLLADRRMLVLLDNARDAEQVRPLLPGASGCLVLVTSRVFLRGLVAGNGARPLTLDSLDRDEARDMLDRRIGGDRTLAEPDAADTIVTRCARLPLAIAVAAAHLSAEPRARLGDLAEQLARSRDRLGALSTGDALTDVRAVLSWSYRALPDQPARLFRLVGTGFGPDISAQAAASLAGLPPERTRHLLTELARAHLVVRGPGDRYSMHELLRAYAAELARDHGTETLDAEQRLLDHYLHSAHAGYRLLRPHGEDVPLPAPRPGTRPERPSSLGEAQTWFATELPVLLAAVDRAAAAGSPSHVWLLAWTLRCHLERTGNWLDQATIGRVGLRAAEQLDDPRAQALCHRILGGSATRTGAFDAASTHFRTALELHRGTDDRTGVADTHFNLSVVLERQHRCEEALDHARRALDLYVATGNRAAQGDALNSVGWLHARLGDHRLAVDACERALVLHEGEGALAGQMATWGSLGFAHHRLGDLRRAIACHQRAIGLSRALGDHYNEADLLGLLGDAYLADGDPRAAERVWRDALAILEDLGHPEAEDVRRRLAGRHLPGPDEPEPMAPGA